jgi:hypothetical protein
VTDVTLEREAKRFIAVRATKNGVTVAPTQYCILPTNVGVRPTILESAWINVVAKGPDVGFYHNPDTVPGKYNVFVRWNDTTEIPVQFAGKLILK